MLRRFKRIKQKIAPYLVSSVVILVTIPIAIYTLLTTDSFDIRNKAQETPTYCTITFPYVNPRTLAVDKRYQINVHAEIENDTITSVNIMDQQAKRLFTKQYSPAATKISETFVYSPRTKGEEQLYGTVKTSTSSYPCKMLNGQEKLFIGIDNTKPTITTDPYKDAIPYTNALPIGDKYEYSLKASDKDLDNLEYSYSFTPRAEWMKMSVVKNGQNGDLELKFTGIPDQVASYLVTVFIHDGYNKHLVYQSWVISTAKDKTELPPAKEPEKEPEVPIPDPGTDDNVKLNSPQITKLNPGEQSTVTNLRSTVSANLTASKNGKITKTSIIFKLDNADVLSKSNIIEFSDSEYTISYTPESNLQNGEHKVFIYFKDSNNKEVQKEWTFTVEGKDQNNGMILGLPTKTFIIIVAGGIMLILALTVPWILYSAWKKDGKEEYEEYPMPKPYNDGPALVPTAQPKHDILGQPVIEPIQKRILVEPPIQQIPTTSEVITAPTPLPPFEESVKNDEIKAEVLEITSTPMKEEVKVEIPEPMATPTLPEAPEMTTTVLPEPLKEEVKIEIPETIVTPTLPEPIKEEIKVEIPETTVTPILPEVPEPTNEEAKIEIPETIITPTLPEVPETTTVLPEPEKEEVKVEIPETIVTPISPDVPETNTVLPEPSTTQPIPFIPQNLPETQVYIEPEIAETPTAPVAPEVPTTTTPEIPVPIEESASLDDLSTGLEDLAQALKTSSFSFLEEDKTKQPSDQKPN